MNGLFLIRDVVQNDLPYLLDIDVKCFELPYPVEAWRFLASDYHLKVATYNHMVVGFAIFQFESKLDRIDTLRIGKIAVKEKYQNLGIGSRLMKQIFHYAEELGCDYLTSKISENLIFDDNERKLLKFLQKWGFKAKDLEKSNVEIYGEPIDIINFETRITNAPRNKPEVLG